MKEYEKIELIDKVLKGLNTTELFTVPELIDGFQKYPTSKSEQDSKYRIIEQEVINLKVAEIFGGGGNDSISGYYFLKITAYGLEFILGKKSIRELYEKKQLTSDQDKKIKELTLEKLKFEKEIRDLEFELKFTSLLKNYWWLIASAIALGITIAKLTKNVW
jgi:hypothetical protein